MKSTDSRGVFAWATQTKKIYLIAAAIALCVLLPIGYGIAEGKLSNTPFSEAIGPEAIGPEQQQDFSGQWTAELKKDSDKLWFSISHQSEWGGFSQSSSKVALNTFKGLTLDQINSAGTNVRFDIVRDAGTIACEGMFKNGRGAGFFTFAPNPTYPSEMKKRGYDNISTKKIFQLAVHDVSLAYIDEIGSAGYNNLSLDKLFAFKIHGVTVQFINDFRTKGYDKIKADDLVAMRIHGVTTEFVESLNSYGFKRLPINDLVAMRIHGATPEFIQEMRELGYTDLSPEKLVAFRIHGVSPEFLKDLKQLGYDKVDANDLLGMRIHNVSAQFIKDVRGLGYEPTLDQFVAMKIHNVTVAYIEKMRARGMKDLTIQELINMRIHGIN